MVLFALTTPFSLQKAMLYVFYVHAYASCVQLLVLGGKYKEIDPKDVYRIKPWILQQQKSLGVSPRLRTWAVYSKA